MLCDEGQFEHGGVAGYGSDGRGHGPLHPQPGRRESGIDGPAEILGPRFSLDGTDRNRFVARLLLHRIEIERCAIKPWWSAGL